MLPMFGMGGGNTRSTNISVIPMTMRVLSAAVTMPVLSTTTAPTAEARWIWMVNNMRLIDADRFCMYLADLHLTNRGWKDDFCEILDDLMESLDEQPTIDAVPVVRCSECKHQEDCFSQIGFWSRDYILEQNNYEYHKLDFCSYGERKE